MQPVMLGHKSRVAGPEAMPLGNARLGILLLKQTKLRGQAVLQRLVPGPVLP